MRKYSVAKQHILCQPFEQRAVSCLQEDVLCQETVLNAGTGDVKLEAATMLINKGKQHLSLREGDDKGFSWK